MLQWSENDAVSLIRMLRWVFDLQQELDADAEVPVFAHCCPRRTPDYLVQEVERLIESMGGSTPTRIQVPFDLPDESYPRGSVWGLWNIARWAYETKTDFLLMEPDMVPLKADWFYRIREEYDACAFPYLGAIEPAHPAGSYPKHMAGCGVYHHGLWQHMATDRLDLAWDVAIAEHVVPIAQQSRVIQQVFGSGSGPRFRSEWDVQRVIREDAALFHRNKDGSVIEILRRRRSTRPEPSCPVQRIQVTHEVLDPVNGRPKVFTYFEPINEQADENLQIIEIWKQTWAKHGWDPVVLNQQVAQRHPRYFELDGWAHLRKTKNQWSYERACYARWMAYAEYGTRFGEQYEPDRMIWFADWDCMNRGLTATAVEGLFHARPLNFGDIDGVPSFGRISGYGLSKLIDMFSDPLCTTGRWCTEDNVSDMNIIRDYLPPRRDLTTLFGAPPTKPLIHFSTHSVGDRNRLAVIQEWARKEGYIA